MKKILVCDDDDGIAEVIKIMLEGAGYAVQVLKNGKGIQKQIKSYQPALILLDLWMPGINGKEIVGLLKRDPEMKKIPVIIISALTETSKIANESGADGFLAKPFEMTDLLSIAQKYSN